MNSECNPISTVPHVHQLFLDYCESRKPLSPFYPVTPFGSTLTAAAPRQHRGELANLLLRQNPHPAAQAHIEQLRNGGSAIVTGQQVGLFGGPLFTLFKAATAIRRARDLSSAGAAHVPIFWLASEDHDFDEIRHVTLPATRSLSRLTYASSVPVPVPVGGIALTEESLPLVEEATSLLGFSDMSEWLKECYQPGRTFAQAFSQLMAGIFRQQGLVVFDANSREAHALGSDVLRHAIERAEELHSALEERNRELSAAGYSPQVLVTENSSLLFLVDSSTGARLPLKRLEGGRFQAGRQSYSAQDLLKILQSEPERISPSALLRPVFQDAIFPTTAYVGGPAEIAYFAQSQVLYQQILGRTTPILPRLTATLIEPSIAELLHRHELSVPGLFPLNAAELAQRLAARTMPVEGKQRLAAAGNALDAELNPLLSYLHGMDEGLGRSAETSARKMRYQMNRLRRLAANFQLQKEASLGRHAEALIQAIVPEGHMQERLLGGVYFLARYGVELVESFVEQAGEDCAGHRVLFL